MAEEVADCINYQADSLPTGSISFGCFATETLAWESRSSFSHNRYLEEVEKYSTPGSVTEKKAYLEFYFKKKHPQLQSLRGRQNETENESKDYNPEGCSGSDSSPGFVDDGPTKVLNASDAQEMSLHREEVTLSEYTASDPTSDERDFHCDTDERHDIQTGNGTISADEDTEPSYLWKMPEIENATLTKPLNKMDVSSDSPSQEKNTFTSKSLIKSTGMTKANLLHENSSGKGSNPKKGAALTHLPNEKCETAFKTSISGSNPAVVSVKEEVKPTIRTFNFRSDERAEKRKEFNMKLEKKLNAKEAEMNEIQARTQEEKEAKIKQLRKSLNFKATPMPSFYHESMPRAPDSKKPELGRSSKLQNRNHAIRPLSNEKCQSSTVVGSRVLSNGEEKSFDHVEDHLIISTGENGSSVFIDEADSADDHQQGSASVQKTGVVKKDEKVKLKMQQQQHHGTGRKGEKFDKQRHLGKVLKGIIGGNVPVGVAS